MIALWIAVWILAGIGALCVASMAGFVLLLARDLRCVKRTRLAREREPLSAWERRRTVRRLERDMRSGGS